jgi:adenine-specific DNA-methyltransferase
MNKRTILQSLSRSVLLETARTFEVPGLSNKKREDIVDALVRIRSLPVEDILSTLQVGELKELCREFEIKPASLRKNDIIKVLSADGNATKPQKENTSVKPVKKTNTIEVVTRKEKSHMARNNSGNQKDIEQYTHETQERLNNPPVGLVTPDTDKDLGKKQYQYDPHLDPQLVWAGKAEHTSFEVPTVSLHVHERIDPKRIIEQVRKEEKQEAEQMSLFAAQERPLREAVEFYKHKDGWTNRLIAGDSLLVMNSLLEKEGMGEKVQMVFFDPPYGIKYGSNFQPFVNKRDVKDGKDEDLSSEPETIKAFRDTWELGIHSYLSYLRDRLYLAKGLLSETGSCFVQISDENVHRVRVIMDEVFGPQNFRCLIAFRTTTGKAAGYLDTTNDFLVWYGKSDNTQFHRPFIPRSYKDDYNLRWVEWPNGNRESLSSAEEIESAIQAGAKVFRPNPLTSQTGSETTTFEYKYNGNKFHPKKGGWKTNIEGMNILAKEKRLMALGNTLCFVRYLDDFPFKPVNNIWDDTRQSGFSDPKKYVVQTAVNVIERCMLMTTDPGDLVLDLTCGSGTTAYVAEQWGRRWITCDTSRVAITLAKQRLIAANFDFFELAQPSEGISSGFRYKTVPHITLKSITNKEPPTQETLYSQPIVDGRKKRVTGPFTVEAVPAPTVKSFDEIETEDTGISDDSVTRSGETLRQSEWRQELLKTGVRGKNGQFIKFSRIEPMSGTLYIQAEGETTWSDAGANTVREAPKGWKPQKVLVCFGPEHAPLEQRTVEMAWQEARPFKPDLMLFCAFQFDEEAAKDIDELSPAVVGMQLLKVQMNADLLTDDLRKKRSSNESFWLIGQPEVEIKEIKKGENKGKYQVEVLGFDYYNPKTGNVESGGKHQIAMWMLDTNYDGRSLFPSQVFFPMA